MVMWSKAAKLELKSIFEFIAQESRYYAKKVTDDIVSKSRHLEQFPFMGRAMPELDEPEIREVFAHSYRIIYEVINTDVKILALVHVKQDMGERD